MVLREQAKENHLKSGSNQPLPKALTEPPPPRPEPYQDEDLADVSVDITANGFDASESFTLDRSMADDIVPASDPGLDKVIVSGFSHDMTVTLLILACDASRIGHTRSATSSESFEPESSHASQISHSP